MAVGPQRVFAGGRACIVEEALLGNQRVGPVRYVSLSNLTLGGGNLFQRSPKVYGARMIAFLGAPGDRTVESIVDFEGAGPVAIAVQTMRVARWKTPSGDPHQLARCHIKQDSAG